MSKGLSAFVVLGVIIILTVVGVGGYVFVKSFSTPATTTTTTTTSTTTQPEAPDENTPEGVAREWYESINDGDLDAAIDMTVDLDGNAYSDTCKTGFNNFYSNMVGTISNLEIGNRGECTPGYFPEGKDCVSVEYSYDYSYDSGSGSASSSLYLVDINGVWKVLVDCTYLPV